MSLENLRDKEKLPDVMLEAWRGSDTQRFKEAARLIDLMEKPIMNYDRPRPTIDEYMAELLPVLSSRGSCPRRKLAAIVTDEHGSLLGTGYNGVARGLPHCIDSPCPGANDKTGDNSRCEALHGEYNAIMQAGPKLVEATRLYCSATPCFNCAKLVLCTGIREVVCLDLYRGDLAGTKLLLRAGREVYLLEFHQAGPELRRRRVQLGLDKEGEVTAVKTPDEQVVDRNAGTNLNSSALLGK